MHTAYMDWNQKYIKRKNVDFSCPSFDATVTFCADINEEKRVEGINLE